MSVDPVVTTLLEIETPENFPGCFSVCIPKLNCRIQRGAEVRLDGEKKVGTVVRADLDHIIEVGDVIRFSAAITSDSIAHRTYRMLKGRRFKNIAVAIDSSETVSFLSLISPGISNILPSVDEPKSVAVVKHDRPSPNSAFQKRTTKRRKILDEVDRGARNGTNIVYMMFNRIDALLYVGITQNGMRRMVQHEREKPWFSEVARIEIERYEELLHAARREKRLIERFAPLYNVTHNLGRQVL